MNNATHDYYHRRYIYTERRREGKKYAFKQSEIKRLLELIRHAKWVEDKYLQK